MNFLGLHPRILLLLLLLIWLLSSCRGNQTSPSEAVDTPTLADTSLNQTEQAQESLLPEAPIATGETVTALELTLSTSPALPYVHIGSQQIQVVAYEEDLARFVFQRVGPSLVVLHDFLPPFNQILGSPNVPEFEVVGEPAEVPVGNGEGVAITLRGEMEGQMFMRRTIFVNNGPGRQYQITLIAPANQWPDASLELEGVLDSIRFEVAASDSEQ